VPRQIALIALLLATFAFEFAGGIALILNPYSNDAAGLVCDLLVALLLIGIARAWELVRERDTSIIASVAVLTGHDRKPDDPLPASAPSAQPRPDQTSRRRRPMTARPAVHEPEEHHQADPVPEHTASRDLDPPEAA